MTCPICNNKATTLRSAVKNGRFISERCDRCLASFVTGAVFARQYERNWQKREYAKDIIQRYEGTDPNPEFVQAYPKQAAEHWGESVLRDNGVNRKQY